MTPQRHGEMTPSTLASSRREGSALPSERAFALPQVLAAVPAQCLECADSDSLKDRLLATILLMIGAKQ
jgi:hypothetical protein